MRSVAAAVSIAGLSVLSHPIAAVPLECPEVSEPSVFAGDLLDSATEARDGVVFDADGPVQLLRLKRAGGYFRSTLLGTTDPTVFAAVADFDGDGWDDFVGGGESSSFLRVYRNRSFENLPVNWDDPNDILKPKFVPVAELEPPGGEGWWHPLAAGDFDGDGRADVFWAASWSYGYPFAAYLYLNAGNDADGNPRFRKRYPAMARGTSPSALGLQNWGGTNTIAVDYNGDRKLDLLVGSGSTDGGSVRIFLNDCPLIDPLPDPLPAEGPLPCASAPRFRYAGYLVRDMGLGGNGRGEFPAIAYEDFDGDGRRDLIAGAPLCCGDPRQRLRIWYGVDGGGVERTASQSVPFVGAATALLVGDFSLDGRPDVVVGTDNWNYPWTGHIGGATYYYRNDGSSTPFAGGVTQQLSRHRDPHWPGNTYDFDLGFVFDYDNDPDGTPDLMIADGNHSSSFYVFANRVVEQYVPCGEVASGILDLGDLVDEEMVVTGARLSPDQRLNGGSIRYYLSNEDPPVWVEATAGACGDGSADVCAQFDRPVGREVRWKAVMCANAYGTATPELYGVAVRFAYTAAAVHYRGGVVVYDGVAYAGGFRQPGDRGHLFATSLGNQTALDGAGLVYWDAARELDRMSDSARHLYAVAPNGERLELSRAGAGTDELQHALGLPPGADSSATTARDVVAWVRDARFGVGNRGIPRSRLGAVETSTPAVLSPPGHPPWYGFLPSADRDAWDEFAAAHADRATLVLFGAKDQLVHAVHTRPTDRSDERNGVEMWAIAPPAVTAAMVADYYASAGGELTIRAYPDGSPTLADVRFADGSFHTVALVAAGNGGRSVFAMDVTDTIGRDGTVRGPAPLWSWTPGGAAAGFAHSKPVVIRVEIAGAPRFLAVLGTGIDSLSADRGRRLVAVDVESGELMWQFDAACALTSDIAAFETDDEREPGGPRVDGFVDRVVFADRCGYVYKLDPSARVPLDGPDAGFAAGLGTIITSNGATALFATAEPDALGEERPIVGTIGVSADQTGRVVLFFGTGGLESLDPTLPNQFYAVYADDGVVRGAVAGDCEDDGRCEKFYGGVLVSAEQVIATRTTDPPVAGGSCDLGHTVVEAFRIDAGDDGSLVVDFTVALASAAVAALFGDAGAVYTTTLDGSTIRIGTPRAADAGDDTANGAGGGFADGHAPGVGSGTDTPTRFTVLGWYQPL